MSSKHKSACFSSLGDRPSARTSFTLPHLGQAFNPPLRKTIIEMLRLCPGDNLGQRSWLGSALLQETPPRASEALSFAQTWMASYTGIVPRGGCNFETPNREALTLTREKKLREFCEDYNAYTAALAAFKLYGPDSVLARQYLRIAAKTNSIVLIKILSGYPRPSSFVSALAKWRLTRVCRRTQ